MIDDALMVLESDPNASKEEGAQEVDDEEEASLPGPAIELMKKEQGEQVCADPVSDASKRHCMDRQLVSKFKNLLTVLL